MGLEVKKGTIQDATFIEADPGSSKKPRGDEAKTRRSKDGTWAKKGDEFHFGYKLHSKVDIDHGLIRVIEITTAKVHDSRVDLSVPGEIVLRDRGIFWGSCKGRGLYYETKNNGPASRRDGNRAKSANKQTEVTR